MKKKYILSIIIMLLFSLNTTAQVFTSKDSEGNDLCYKITSDNTVMLIRDQHKRYENVKTVAIPSSVYYQGKTYVVSELQAECFSFCQSLVEISIPSSIRVIPDKFLYVCYSLWKVSLPSTITEFGKQAFASCSSLQQIEIPKSVTKMGGGCFCYSGITSIQIPNGVTSLHSDIDGGTSPTANGFFQGCKNLSDIDLPNSIIELGPACFSGCKQLKRIVLPNKIERLPSYDNEGCFRNCSNLEEIVLPANLKKIGADCFHSCYKLKSVKGLHAGISLNRYYYQGNSWGPFSSSSFKIDSVMNTFSYYALGIVKKEIDEWQKKRDFETTAQYQQRVTKETRDQKIAALIEKAKADYIANPKKKIVNIIVGDYDSDYGVLALNVEVCEYNNDKGEYNNYNGKKMAKYIKMPNSEVEKFRKKFNVNKVKSTYIIHNDNSVLADLEIQIGNKTYSTEPISKDYFENDIAINLPDINIYEEETTIQSKPKSSKPVYVIDNAIDQNIPVSAAINKQTFAVIIGNERYTQVAHVPYANNDAMIFAEYCKKTLGLPDKNVKVYENATYGTMIGAVSDIQKIAKAFKGDIKVIFYYAGHGIPDEATGDGYLLPIDADGMNMRVCYPLSQLYKDLGEMQARSVTCFMDACFSGAQRGDGMVVAARGVAIKAKSDRPIGHTVVFTAATGKQTAYPFEEKGHGMFTYYLLKKLRETKGICTLGELGSYISDEVAKQAVVTNGKEQTPIVLTSDGMGENWKNMKLK